MMVVHPGHPLIGQSVIVVRRTRQQGERYWVVEVPDGSRQYIPAAWCLPLRPDAGSVMGKTMKDPTPTDPHPSPLSLPVLRDLATLVRRLQEARRPGGEDHATAAAHPHAQTAHLGQAGSGSLSEHATRQPERDAPSLGELFGAGSPPGDLHLDPGRTPGRTAAAAEATGEGVRDDAV